MPPQPNNLGPGETPYTPVLTATTTNPDLGTGGSATGGWHFVDSQLVWFWALFVFGSSPDPGSGYYQVSVPVPPVTDNRRLGDGAVIDASASSEIRPVAVICASALAQALSVSAERAFLTDMSAPAGITAALVSDAAPFVWAEGDQINISGLYQIV